ncbi:HNH endonuclease signature motif containing protein [Corynebacterium vitaeruminis]|uniref:HNH endonuclease signature motif containing protein n=1 Tax=Corynebacterium vitaeruminis TaxID=38305 RepID=UPI0023F40A75|nr:HNH endonuclease signature motif containing protein [Corynebacterium vitaeruminis]
MNALRAYGAARGNPLPLLREARGRSAAEIAAEGVDDADAALLCQLADVYVGETSFSRRQKDAVAAIEANGHSMAALEIVERLARALPQQHLKWQLRVELCRTPGSAGELEARGAALLSELKPERKDPEPGARIKRRPSQVWSVTFTGPAEKIAEIYEPVKHEDDPVEAARAAMSGGEGVATVLRPMVVIPLDELDTVLDGTGDETVLRCSDGVERTSTQVAQMAMDKRWHFALMHPVEGPVDLVRSERVANRKQRMLATAENPTCPWDGCNKPADECQVHHLRPWQLGGHTVSKNLTTCCAYHNGVNDDNPNAPPRRGRLERRGGRVKRVYR